MVPDALGQKVWFEESEGPKLEALTDPAQFGQLSRARLGDHLAPVYRAIKATRAALPKDTALLGFAGAPFTLACYMIEGGSSRDFAKVGMGLSVRSLDLLIDLLVEAIVDHLATGRSRCRAVQADMGGLLPEDNCSCWSLEPMVRSRTARSPSKGHHRLSTRRRPRC